MPHIETGILAPELADGLRMDLNRPLGDGHDNNGNGIVDEPAEAGEPFLDLNGNGKYDDGTFALLEPYIDENGNGRYDGPQDQLWPQLTGAGGPVTEKIAFDYLRGQGEPLHPLAPGFGPLVNVRNLGAEGRQRFARHLYCLMLLLMDENYVDTPNVPSLGGDDINEEWLREAIEAAYKKEIPTASDADINAEVMRKLTARRVAQWAINVVDFRDADTIMTPFEYDENPWNGWGVPVADVNDSTKIQNLPLDGDIATNENNGELIDWSKVRTTRTTGDRPNAGHEQCGGRAGSRRAGDGAQPDARRGVGRRAAGAIDHRDAGPARPPDD